MVGWNKYTSDYEQHCKSRLPKVKTYARCFIDNFSLPYNDESTLSLLLY